MGNKSVNFGYINDGDVLDKLKVNDYLRGCNPIEGEDISNFCDEETLPSYMLKYLPKMDSLDLPKALKSFTYRKLAVGSNEKLEKFAYIHLIVSSFCEQIFENLSRDGLVFCNFESLDNKDIEDLTDTVNYFSDVLEFRGYTTRVINGELLVINVPEYTDERSINEITNMFHKNSVTVQLHDNLDYKEEEVYKACSELLRLLPNYYDIEELWRDCKSKLDIREMLDFNELFHLAYHMLYVYAFFNQTPDTNYDWYFLKDYSVSNMASVVHKIAVEPRQRIKQFIEDIADTAFLLDSTDINQLEVGKEVIMDCMENVEVLVDGCFTPELKVFKSLDISTDDFDYLCYYLVKSHTELREPITLDEISEIEEYDDTLDLPMQDEVEEIDEVSMEREVLVNKNKRNLFRRYLPALTGVIVVLAIALSLLVNS